MILLIILISIWQFWKWLQLKKVIAVSRQVKCAYTAYPLIGHGYMFIGNGYRRMQAFILFGREALKQCGLTNLWVGRNYLLVVADPVDVDVLAKSCLEKDDLIRFAREFIGNGTIFAPVKIWHPRRKILASTFHLRNLKNFVNIFSKQSNVMVNQLKEMAGKGSFSIWTYLTSYTMNSVCETALGVDMSHERHQNSLFLKSFEKICQLIAVRMLFPWLHSDYVYKMLPSYHSFIKNKKKLYGFVDDIIKSKSELLRPGGFTANKKEGSTESKIETFLELLSKSSSMEKVYNDTELREEILVILLAGTDTSAVGTSFVSLMLSRHQDVQEKVYQELQCILKNTNRSIEFQDLSRLKYLEAVICETLRLYPPVPVTVRKVESDITLPSGVNLGPGCGVMFHIWAIQRNPRYWGADAEIFRPERFLDTPPSHPQAYMAFSTGPRNCLGYKYAMMSMKTAVASLVRQFRLLPAKESVGSDDLDIRVTFDIMMKDEGQFKVKLENRL